MILIPNVTYPPESVREITKRFLTAPALPSFLGRHFLNHPSPSSLGGTPQKSVNLLFKQPE